MCIRDSPYSYLVFLLWALSTGEYLLARLVAETASTALGRENLGQFFRKVAEALASGDRAALKSALAELYFYAI